MSNSIHRLWVVVILLFFCICGVGYLLHNTLKDVRYLYNDLEHMEERHKALEYQLFKVLKIHERAVDTIYIIPQENTTMFIK